jgi:hypothetical protein
LPKEVLDALPFGVIRVDVAGMVVFFSHTEAEQSCDKQRKAIGLRFFTEDAERELHVRAISATAGGMWLFIRRPGRAVG